MEEMSRCIHCTRCVRFGQEVAGVMELGMIHRGEHSEITTFAGDTIDSELSGNMIDICPVGALTSKPFRYSARTWELSRRKSVSPHDSTGANLVVQVKNNRVMRVVPLENEAVNECWIADRDRFSLRGRQQRRPADRADDQAGRRVEGGRLDDRARLRGARPEADRADHGAQRIGALASAAPHGRGTAPAGQLVRGLGSENIDHRLRHADFANAAPAGAARWLGTPIASLSDLQRVLVVGSFLRKDHPLFAQRIRQAARKGAQGVRAPRRRRRLADAGGRPHHRRAERLGAGAGRRLRRGRAGQGRRRAGGRRRPTTRREAIAAALLAGERKAVLLGNAAAQHPQAGALLALAQWLGEQTGASVGYLGEAANSVGAQLVGALPRRGRPERRPDAGARGAPEGPAAARRRAVARRRRRRPRRAPRWPRPRWSSR